jgi:hypothetical protein
MPLGQGYTVEEQMTGQAKQGGIQIDVFPTLKASVSFRTEDEEVKPPHLGKDLPLGCSPQSSGVTVGSQIVMTM